MAASSSENLTGIVNQSTSLFDVPSTKAGTLLGLQTVATTPFVTELPTTTGMVLPDVAFYKRLQHFPEDLYDLRPASHLVRFIAALLGDGGVGQLRKRYSMSQFERSLSSTHFYDLDRFYGALFGARRGAFGALPVDPTTSVATPDGWDEIHDLDSTFRERVIKLAKAITLGATPMGMQALAEALTGVECDIYEVWRQIDTSPAPGAGNTYANVGSTYANYGQMAPFRWGQVTGQPAYGNLAINARNEFSLRPKLTYDPSDPVSAVKHAEDLYGILRVVNVLKPANTLVTVQDDGLAVHRQVPIRAVSADSEYWEVTSRVIPQPGTESAYQTVYSAFDKRSNPTSVQMAVPRPPFSSSQGQEWSYAGEVTSVKGYVRPLAGPLPAPLTNNFEQVRFPDGKEYAYRPEYAIIDPKQAHAAQVAKTGAISVHPFSGPRKKVPTHG
jgi:hypothetical protein